MPTASKRSASAPPFPDTCECNGIRLDDNPAFLRFVGNRMLETGRFLIDRYRGEAKLSDRDGYVVSDRLLRMDGLHSIVVEHKADGNSIE